MEGEGGVTRSLIDEVHRSRGIIDELHFWDIQGDQMEGESGVTRSIIDQLHSSGIQ